MNKYTSFYNSAVYPKECTVNRPWLVLKKFSEAGWNSRYYPNEYIYEYQIQTNDHYYICRLYE